jgi:division protein CdvB (Snf7/Vps24/ESCRT-III family)
VVPIDRALRQHIAKQEAQLDRHSERLAQIEPQLGRHSERLMSIELWKAAHEAESILVIEQVQLKLNDLKEAFEKSTKVLEEVNVAGRISATRIGIYAGIGSSVALAVLGAVVATLFSIFKGGTP